MAGIHWLTCPKCSYRFYILQEEAGHNYEWFCPRCQARFTEAEAASPEGGQSGTAGTDHPDSSLSQPKTA